MEFKNPASNSIALKAVRAILNGSASCTLKVADQKVEINVTRQDMKWPEELPGLSAQTDKPWPQRQLVRCTWDTGSVEFRLEASYWTVKHKTYGGQVGLLLRYNHPGRAEQQVVWCTVATSVGSPTSRGCSAISPLFQFFSRTLALMLSR
ncbi:MAG: hypothetical protein ACKO6N_05675 [Myxococcota bacterium]